jgi:uncharacterized membrane protein YtjA (UPF0391 family)
VRSVRLSALNHQKCAGFFAIVGFVLHGLCACPYCIRLQRRVMLLSRPIQIFRRYQMLHYAVVFFVIALIAALLGFTGIAASAAGIAKILFVVFLVVALVTFLLSKSKRT